MEIWATITRAVTPGFPADIGAVTITCPSQPDVEPVRDAQARKIDAELGYRSVPSMIRADGRDPDDVVRDQDGIPDPGATEEAAAMKFLAIPGLVTPRPWGGLRMDARGFRGTTIEAKACPFLDSHDNEKQMGNIASYEVSGQQMIYEVPDDQRSQRAAALEIWHDIDAGIRPNISAGWEIYDIEVEDLPDGSYVATATDFDMLESSSVTMPYRLGAAMIPGESADREDGTYRVTDVKETYIGLAATKHARILESWESGQRKQPASNTPPSRTEGREEHMDPKELAITSGDARPDRSDGRGGPEGMDPRPGDGPHRGGPE